MVMMMKMTRMMNENEDNLLRRRLRLQVGGVAPLESTVLLERGCVCECECVCDLLSFLHP